MKTILPALFFSLIFVQLVHSQDLIIKTNQDTILSKVLEVADEIRYKEFNFENGPTYVILKTDVAFIKYENGRIDTLSTLNVINPAPKTDGNIVGLDMYTRGSKDATRYYNGYKGAATGTLIVSLISPLFGLIPAALCASSEPQTERLNFPDTKLLNYSEYEYGYRERAKKMKKSKVWTNWGIGLGVNLVLFIALTSGN